MRVEALVRKFFGVKSTWCKNGLVKKTCDKLFGVRAFSVKTVHAKEQLVYICVYKSCFVSKVSVVFLV